MDTLTIIYFLGAIGFFMGSWEAEEDKNFGTFYGTFMTSLLWVVILVADYVQKSILENEENET
jgi:hypothetical protein